MRVSRTPSEYMSNGKYKKIAKEKDLEHVGVEKHKRERGLFSIVSYFSKKVN